jgi:hypothetical protein
VSTTEESYLAGNRAFWEGLTPDAGAYGDQLAHGRQRWSAPAPVWGDWSVPESRLRLLPDDVAGTDMLELGCGCCSDPARLTTRYGPRCGRSRAGPGGAGRRQQR